MVSDLGRWLRLHVVLADASNSNRLFHRIATERLAQFLVDHRFDQRGLARFLIFNRLLQRSGQLIHGPGHDTLQATGLRDTGIRHLRVQLSADKVVVKL